MNDFTSMSILEQLCHLQDGSPRMAITHSLSHDLELARLKMQYFLGQRSNTITPEIILRELAGPPTDASVIRARQHLVELLIRDQHKLSELNDALLLLSYSFNRKRDEISIEYHTANTSNRVFSKILENLVQADRFTTIRETIDSILTSTKLPEELAAWSRMIAEGIPAHIELGNGIVTYLLPSGDIVRDEVLRVVDLKKKLEAPVKERLDIIRSEIDPLIHQLFDVLGFYVALARYGIFLKENKKYCMPEIVGTPGYLDARKFYNPLLGLPSVDFYNRDRGVFPSFPDSVYPHDYPGSSRKIHIALGRNKGSKSTWLTGRGIIQLMAQIGSPVPAEYCRIGPVDSMASVYVKEVDIGRDQSSFTRKQDEMGHSLDVVTENGLILCDDATEGSDHDNSRDYMDFLLRKFDRMGLTAFLASQDRRLWISQGLPSAQFYTTVPNTYSIKPLNPEEEPERTNWRATAKGTALGKHLEK